MYFFLLNPFFIDQPFRSFMTIDFNYNDFEEVIEWQLNKLGTSLDEMKKIYNLVLFD